MHLNIFVISVMIKLQFNAFIIYTDMHYIFKITYYIYHVTHNFLSVLKCIKKHSNNSVISVSGLFIH